MMTPELRFDADGFVDLSVFPDTEPDVHGHGPGVLDPALARDRDLLDRTFDPIWISGVLDGALTGGPGAGPDELGPLVPSTFTAPMDPTPTTGDPVRGPAAAAEDDIDLESIRHLVGPRPAGARADGSDRGHDR